MADNVHYLVPRQAEIGHYFRLGHTGYRILENLHAVGRLPIKRAIVDASHMEKQKDLLTILHAVNVELILDPKAAELATPGGYSTSARSLSWAHDKRPHVLTDFTKTNLREYCEKLAEFAVMHHMDVVHCPTHMISGSQDPWLNIDSELVGALRSALDRLGGQKVQIDYPLVIPYGVFRKRDECKIIAQRLAGLPYINLWLRVSGFGMSDASPSGVQQYIQSAWEFQSIGKPVVADGVAGLVGASILAFGAAGGIAHGIAEKDNFNAQHWKKPSKKGGGGRKRIYMPEIDLYLYADQAECLLKGRGAKAMLSCNDIGCCARIKDMFESHKAHAIHQSSKLIRGFNGAPEGRLVDHLVSKHLIPVGRTLRKAEGLKLDSSELMNKIGKKSRKVDLMHQALDRLSESIDEAPRAQKPEKRHVEYKTLDRIG